MKIEVVPSIALHCTELSRTLREKDRQEAIGLGLEPRRGIFRAYRGACYRKTVVVNDDVAAMFGLHGELLGMTGRPYLITGTVSDTVSPIRFARIYKKEAQIMSQMFPVLENVVDASYEEAVRMLGIAGFSVSSELIEMTPRHFYRKFSMVTI